MSPRSLPVEIWAAISFSKCKAADFDLITLQVILIKFSVTLIPLAYHFRIAALC
jgi:hypothetical protein